MNSLRFCFSWNLFISLWILDNLASRVFLVSSSVSIFFYRYLEYIMPFPPGLQASAEKFVYSLEGVPSHWTSYYSVAVLKILSLPLSLLGFILLATPWDSRIWTSVSFPKLVTLSHYLLKHSFFPFLFLFFFWNSYTANSFLFGVSHRLLTLSPLFFFFSFLMLCSDEFPPCLPGHWFFLLLFSDQCKETEENNRVGKAKDRFKKKSRNMW